MGSDLTGVGAGVGVGTGVGAVCSAPGDPVSGAEIKGTVMVIWVSGVVAETVPAEAAWSNPVR
jgi:hypothetical protein